MWSQLWLGTSASCLGCWRPRQGKIAKSSVFKLFIFVKNSAILFYNGKSWNLFRSNRCGRHYFQNAQGLVFVVDSNDQDRVVEAYDKLHRMLNEVSVAYLLISKLDYLNGSVLTYMNKSSVLIYITCKSLRELVQIFHWFLAFWRMTCRTLFYLCLLINKTFWILWVLLK